MSNRGASVVIRAGAVLGLACWAFAADAKRQATQPAHTAGAAPATEKVSEDHASEKNTRVQFEWVAFPDEARFKLLGLHWQKENRPQLWRMPKAQFEALPKGVKARAKAPSGGRLLIKCDTGDLGLKVTPLSEGSQKGFDVYINGRFLRSVIAEQRDVSRELVLFKGMGHDQKEIVIYLPYSQEVVIEAVGVDPDTKFNPPERKYARPLPVVFYGSSVCQGSGASKPGMSYEAIACRELNLDFVNLGFGGAGKAEKPVVDLVASIPACCYVFDLGKSYGMQDKSAYKEMLQTVRARRPDVPIICITPITSTLEVHDQEYSRKSVHARTVMREAVGELIASGERNILLVEGTELLGFDEHDGLSKDGVHPSDQGFSMIAGKLSPVLGQAIGLRMPNPASRPLKSF